MLCFEFYCGLLIIIGWFCYYSYLSFSLMLGPFVITHVRQVLGGFLHFYMVHYWPLGGQTCCFVVRFKCLSKVNVIRLVSRC